MGAISRFFGRFFGSARVRYYADSTDHKDDILRNIFEQSHYDTLARLRTHATTRKGAIEELQEMIKDGVTLAAVNLLAEDATQLDRDHGAVAWVECTESPEFAAEMSQYLLEDVDVNSLVYQVVFDVIVYGECYLRTHYEDREGYLHKFKLGEYYMIEDVAAVQHLYHYGVPVGYIRESPTEPGTTEVLPEKSYIHFCNNRGGREQVLPHDTNTYVSYGTSFLEGAKCYYKQRQLLDDLLLLARLTRSSKYNLFSVEVGGATSEDTARMIQEVRTAIQQRQELNVSTQVFSSKNAPLLSGGNVYFPVRNGVGAVNVHQVSDDPNINALRDLEYFSQNYYSALGVPQAFLGNTSELPGGLGENTLTQLDIRYARTVRRIQNILKNGLRDLVVWKCMMDRRSVPKFVVQMSHIYTAEDDRKSKVFADATQRMRDMLDILSMIDPTIYERVDQQRVLYYVLNALGVDSKLLDIFCPTEAGLAEGAEEDEHSPAPPTALAAEDPAADATAAALEPGAVGPSSDTWSDSTPEQPPPQTQRRGAILQPAQPGEGLPGGAAPAVSIPEM
jgi:hypothetical protein